MSLVLPFVRLCVLLGLGHLAREKIKLLQKLDLPSCVIAGLLGLVAVELIVHQAQDHRQDRLCASGSA